MKSKRILRTLSLLLLQTFLFRELAFAEGLAPLLKQELEPKPAVSIQFPLSTAAVEDAYKNGGGKLFYLLQDAHTNESGQYNLAKTLSIILSKEKDLKHVFTEAGAGDNSLSFLRKYRTEKEREAIARSYIRKGYLHGAEYLDLTSDQVFTLWGVEDLGLYSKALEDYRQVAKERGRFELYLNKIEATVETLKGRLFNPSLAAFAKERKEYREERLPLTSYFGALMRERELRNVPLSDYPHLGLLRDLKEKEEKLDFKKANEEHRKAAGSLPAESLKELKALSDAGNRADKVLQGRQDVQAYFFALEEKLGKRKSAYPELSKYLDYIRASRELEAKQVLKEIDSIEKEILKRLFRTEEEKTLLACDDGLFYRRKLFRFTLTPEEYAVYKEHAAKLPIDSLTGFLNKQIMDLGTYYERSLFLEAGYDGILQRAESFYEITKDRDEQFLKASLEKLEKENASKAVLITGGFHTANLKALLKERGISYVSITPQVWQETNLKKYESVLLGQNLNSLPAAPRAGSATIGVLAARTGVWGGDFIRDISASDVSGGILAELRNAGYEPEAPSEGRPVLAAVAAAALVAGAAGAIAAVDHFTHHPPAGVDQLMQQIKDEMIPPQDDSYGARLAEEVSVPKDIQSAFREQGLVFDLLSVRRVVVDEATGRARLVSEVPQDGIDSIPVKAGLTVSILQALAGSLHAGTLGQLMGRKAKEAGGDYGKIVDSAAVVVGKKAMETLAKTLGITIIIGGNEGSFRDESADLKVGMVINPGAANGAYFYFGDSVEVTNGVKREIGRPGTSSMILLVPAPMMPSTDGYRISLALDKFNPGQPFPEIDPVITGTNTLKTVLTQIANYMGHTSQEEVDAFIAQMASEYTIATLDRPKHDQLNAQAKDLGFSVVVREDGDPILFIRSMLGVKGADGKKLFTISTGGSNEHIMAMAFAALYGKALMFSAHASTENLKQVDKIHQGTGQGNMHSAKDFTDGDMAQFHDVNGGVADLAHVHGGKDIAFGPTTREHAIEHVLNPRSPELDSILNGPAALVISSNTGANRMDWGELSHFMKPVTWNISPDGQGRVEVSGFFIGGDGHTYFYNAELNTPDAIDARYGLLAANIHMAEKEFQNPLLAEYDVLRKALKKALQAGKSAHGEALFVDDILDYSIFVGDILEKEAGMGELRDFVHEAAQKALKSTDYEDLRKAVDAVDEYFLGSPSVAMEDGSTHEIVRRPAVGARLAKSGDVSDVASRIKDAYDRYISQIYAINDRAAERFIHRDVDGIEEDQAELVILFAKHLDEVREWMMAELGDKLYDMKFWDDLEAYYLHRSVSHEYDRGLAKKFFEALMGRIYAELPGHSYLEFGDDGIEGPGPVSASIQVPYRTYSMKGTTDTVRRLFDGLPFRDAMSQENVDKAVAQTAMRLEERLGKGPFKDILANGRIEVLSDHPFYRNKGAYVMGLLKTPNGKVVAPIVLAFTNRPKNGGIRLHAILTDFTIANRLFHSSRTNFRVPGLQGHYREILDFLWQVIPERDAAVVYSAIGFLYPSKMRFLRRLREYLKPNMEFEKTEGREGTVMLAMKLKGFPFIFKVIREAALEQPGAQPKGLGNPHALVTAKYREADKRNRVGRKLGAMKFYRIAFRARNFSDEILDNFRKEFKDHVQFVQDPQTGEQMVLIKDLYVQSEVVPLDVYLSDPDLAPAEEFRVIKDYLQALIALAQAGIFQSDPKIQNFGVTPDGYVVSFDNDDMLPVEELGYIQMHSDVRSSVMSPASKETTMQNRYKDPDYIDSDPKYAPFRVRNAELVVVTDYNLFSHLADRLYGFLKNDAMDQAEVKALIERFQNTLEKAEFWEEIKRGLITQRDIPEFFSYPASEWVEPPAAGTPSADSPVSRLIDVDQHGRFVPAGLPVILIVDHDPSMRRYYVGDILTQLGEGRSLRDFQVVQVEELGDALLAMETAKEAGLPLYLISTAFITDSRQNGVPWGASGAALHQAVSDAGYPAVFIAGKKPDYVDEGHFVQMTGNGHVPPNKRIPPETLISAVQSLFQASSGARLASAGFSQTAIIFPPASTPLSDPGKDLYENYGYVRELYAQVNEAAGQLFGDPSFDLRITQTAIGRHVASLAYEMALWEVYKEEVLQGNVPKAVMGVSRGSIAAFYAAGVIDLKLAVELMIRNMQFLEIASHDTGDRRMDLVWVAEEDLQPILDRHKGVITLRVTHKQFIISAPAAELGAIERELAEKKRRFIPSVVTVATHDPNLVFRNGVDGEKTALAEEFEAYLRNDIAPRMKLPQTTLYSSITGKPLVTVEDLIGEAWGFLYEAIPLDRTLPSIQSAEGIQNFIVVGGFDFMVLSQKKAGLLPADITSSALYDKNDIQDFLAPPAIPAAPARPAAAADVPESPALKGYQVVVEPSAHTPPNENVLLWEVVLNQDGLLRRETGDIGPIPVSKGITAEEIAQAVAAPIRFLSPDDHGFYSFVMSITQGLERAEKAANETNISRFLQHFQVRAVLAHAAEFMGPEDEKILAIRLDERTLLRLGHRFDKKTGKLTVTDKASNKVTVLDVHAFKDIPDWPAGKISLADAKLLEEQAHSAIVGELGPLAELHTNKKVLIMESLSRIGQPGVSPALAVFAANALRHVRERKDANVRFGVEGMEMEDIRTHLAKLEEDSRLAPGTLTSLFELKDFEAQETVYIASPGSLKAGSRNLVVKPNASADMTLAAVSGRLEESELTRPEFVSAVKTRLDRSIQFDINIFLKVFKGLEENIRIQELYALLPAVELIDWQMGARLAALQLRTTGSAA